MARTSSDISQQIMAQLKVLLPDLSLDPLTPERKIVDTVSEIVAEASIDQYILNYQYDVDTKVGSDLDKFIALFGFARQSGRRSTGSITFSRSAAADTDIFIPAGTIVQKPSTVITGVVSFTTTASVVLTTGGVSVDAPIESTDEGGLGNVPAGSITSLAGGGSVDISNIVNVLATTGGSAAESDAELRVRFKNTIFRNIAGTKDQFLALAIATRFTNKANVLGPISRFIEYIQVTPTLTISSIIPYSKYTYSFDYYITNGNLNNEIFYTPNSVDYTFAPNVPPTITVTNPTNLVPGNVYLLEHTYCSSNSRNDPSNNIANYVDVYISGQDGTHATETVAYPSSLTNFVNTAGYFDYHNYKRTVDGTNPIIGNRLQELLWQPVLDLPTVITINGVDYFAGTHYWRVKDVTPYKGSKRARDGIEWSSAVSSLVTAGTVYTLDYDFDKLPIIVNELMDKHKQITSDVLVHSAVERYLNINLIVMYIPGFSRSSVDSGLQATLTSFLERQQFGAVIQISDLLEVAHEVSGVDNIRLATPGDGVAYGVQEVGADGITPLATPYATDFALQDSDLPVLNRVVTTQKSQNTW